MMELQLLRKIDVNNVAKVLHGVFDGVCHRSSVQYKDFSDVWDLDEWWSITDALRTFCEKCVSEQWSRDEIQRHLGDLPDTYVTEVVNAINVRRSELRTALIETSCAISHDHLNDFDWQVKLVMASDSLASLHQPLASVDFSVANKGLERTTSLELNQEEIRKMIQSLEACNRVVNQMKT